MKAEMKILIWVILLTLISVSCTSDDNDGFDDPDPIVILPTETLVQSQFKTETFTFSSSGKDIKGIIYLPDSYKTNKSLPTIYLIDYKESHFKVATDEFDQVIKAVQKNGFDAIVVTLNELRQIQTSTGHVKEQYTLFKNMASFVDETYTNNTSRTLIGRGSDGGVVLLTLLHENPETSIFDNFIVTGTPGDFNTAMIKNLTNNISTNIQNKKLHFSYDTAETEGEKHDWKNLINLINQKQYPWLKFESKAYNQNFETAYPIAFNDGIKFVFGSNNTKL